MKNIISDLNIQITNSQFEYVWSRALKQKLEKYNSDLNKACDKLFKYKNKNNGKQVILYIII